VWTFGNLIKNIANTPVTGVSVKTFLKEWVRGWVSGRNINGQNVPARKDVLRYLIGPWLQKCNSSLGSNYYNILADNYILNSTNQWEDDWDSPAISESDLLKYAPFKLMAIVNRIDLMGNLGYANNINNAGETRFIYTLEAPFALTSSTGVQTPAGFPPRNGDGAGNNICVNPIDWEGMNVIIEYGNPFTNVCQLWNYQYDWYQLSRLTLGSPEYNTALEAITHKVIDANVAPNKPNKSALDQIRTNERIFFESGCPFNQFQDNWSKSDWELSQFELNGTNHMLLPVAVSNTPANTANVPWYLQGTNNLSTAGSGMGFYSLVSANNNQGELLDPSQYHGSTALLEWVFAHKNQVKQGMHNLPNSFSYGYSLDNGNYTGTDHFDKAATALMDAEQVHYWDLAWYNSPTAHYNNVYGVPGNYEIDKDVRQQLSLNTCHGCHGGETKTNFTMVRPLPYGQAANYWGETPNDPDGKFPVDKRKLDTRFVKTNGISKVVVTGDAIPVGTTYDNYPLPAVSSEQYFTRVSPFITGRNYSGAGTWQDDLISDGVSGMNTTQIEIAATADDQTDQNFENPPKKNLFFVFDPANYEAATYPGPNRVNGYNELDKRKGILCQFLNTDCHNEGSGGGKGQGVIFSIMEKTSFMPLPYRGH
jgi:hypothetical protein